MKITDIKIFSAEVKLKQPVNTAYGSYDANQFIFVKLCSDEGHVGFGEVSCGVTRQYGGFTVQSTVDNIRRFFIPQLVSADPLNIGRIITKLRYPISRSQEEREISARAAVDTALHDLVSRKLGIPTCYLLGGRLIDKIRVSGIVSDPSPKKAAQEAVKQVDHGYASIKVKVGMDIEKDVERFRAIRTAVGPDTSLWIDPNEQLTVTESIKMIEKLSKYGLSYVEQPVPGWDLKGMTRIRQRFDSQIKIIADQSVFSVYDAIKVIEANAADIINLKIMRTGITDSKRITWLAEAAGLQCKLGTGGEAGVGVAAGLHLLASASNINTDTSEIRLASLRKTLVRGLQSKDKWGAGWEVPNGPGHGVEVLEGELQEHKI